MAETLRTLFGGRVRFHEPLARYTSFRIGGPADAWVEVSTPEEILRLQEVAAAASLPLVVLGGGTNVLVSDRGVRGIVVRLGRAFAGIEWAVAAEATTVVAGAAVRLKRLVTEAAARSLTGIEFAEGIPGSVGGGLLMNAGAFGGEMADVLVAVHGVEPARGVRRVAHADLPSGYRRCDLPAGFVVTHVELALAPGDPRAIRVRLADLRRRRGARQPAGLPNAGSIFRNPPGAFAGRLIEAAGLKGRRVGGAMVSERHANFIVNVDHATAADVKRLMDEISEAVWTRESVRLVPEVKLVGEWGNA